MGAIMVNPALRVCIMASLLATAGAAAAQDRATVYDGWIYDRASGCLLFVPELRDYTRVAWQGACVDGRGQGPGTLQVAVAGTSDRTYEVRFENGRIVGSGVVSWANGDRYEGEFRNGHRT